MTRYRNTYVNNQTPNARQRAGMIFDTRKEAEEYAQSCQVANEGRFTFWVEEILDEAEWQAEAEESEPHPQPPPPERNEVRD